MTNEELQVSMKKIEEFINKNDMNSINNELEKMHPSTRYNVIGLITKWKSFTELVKKVRSEAMKQDAGSTNKPYQKYQDLKAEAVKMHEHDNTPAKMIDVDRAVWNAYCICIRMIGMVNSKVDKQSEAINRIEKTLGLEPTDFNEGSDGNGTITDNVQKYEDIGRPTGEVSQ